MRQIIKQLIEVGAKSSNGIIREPRYVRVYDNQGETLDRYTVLFTRKRVDGEFFGLDMSENPIDPNGIGQHFSSPDILDYPSSSHLGKRIRFNDLPKICQKLVIEDYKTIWEITEKNQKLNLFRSSQNTTD